MSTPNGYIGVLLGILGIVFRKRWARNIVRSQERLWSWKPTESYETQMRWGVVFLSSLFILLGIMEIMVM